MTSKKQAVFFVAALVMALLTMSFANALESLVIEVNGVTIEDGTNVASFVDETLPVRVTFVSNTSASDVRVKAWISGQKEYAEVTERFEVLGGRTYSKTLYIKNPSSIKQLDKIVQLNIVIEGERGILAQAERKIDLTVQRESYKIEILDVIMDNKVNAGDTLPVTVVLKNRGMYKSDDNFVVIKIPSLGVEERSYFGDLLAIDGEDSDRDDTIEKRVFLKIPAKAATNLYSVEVQAFNEDSVAIATRKVAVIAQDEKSIVAPSSTSKKVAVNEKTTFSITLVNPSDKIKLYDFVVDSPEEVSLEMEDRLVAVPAGESKTVKLNAWANKAGKHSFDVEINSDGQTIGKETFFINAEGTKILAMDTTVLLTVVLAIIFVVLLIVLIVLLTKKPKRSEELGESYY